MIRKNDTTTASKRRQARESSTRNGDVASAMEKMPSKIASQPCPICGNADEGAGRILIGEYRSEQRELLERHIREIWPDFDPSRTVCPACLERAERELQRRQIIDRDGDPYFVDLDLSGYPILSTPERVDADPRFTGRGVTIAFIDSGFYPHPDLLFPTSRILAMYDAVHCRRIVDVESLVEVEPGPEAWHGTMTVCTAAGNGYLSHGRYRGIASEANLVLIRVMSEHGIKTPEVVTALRWVREHRERYNIRVVNMSLGVDETTDSLDHPVVALVEELTRLGVVIVAASGNDPREPIKPPAAAPSAITVGGYDDHNSTEWMRRELWHSSYGNTPNGALKPELLAPAIWVAAPILPRTAVKTEAEALFYMACADDEELMRAIPTLAWQTWIRGKLIEARTPLQARSAVLRRIIEEKQITPNYKHVDGTSFAAPIITSVVAQLIEARPDLSPRDVKRLLLRTARALPHAPREVQGHGVVQPRRVIEAALKQRESERAAALREEIDRELKRIP